MHRSKFLHNLFVGRRRGNLLDIAQLAPFSCRAHAKLSRNWSDVLFAAPKSTVPAPLFLGGSSRLYTLKRSLLDGSLMAREAFTCSGASLSIDFGSDGVADDQHHGHFTLRIGSSFHSLVGGTSYIESSKNSSYT